VPVSRRVNGAPVEMNWRQDIGKFGYRQQRSPKELQTVR
jgi:hypothetical protein